MTNRRTLGSAIDMTPEKLAFIHGESRAAAKPPAAPPMATAEVKTIDVGISSKTAESANESPSRPPRRGPQRVRQDAPDAGEILDRVLVPVTIRLRHRLASALKRAYLEQKLQCEKPDTQQEIVEEALGNWLSRRGFLEPKAP